MFETEDMLPRPPPMPSAPVNTDVIKPTVPEVSIIFAKEAPKESTENKQPQTYASWRRQNLPRVTFPPNLNDEPYMPGSGGSSASASTYAPSSSSTSSSNHITSPSVFPMRPVTTIAPTPIAMTYSNAYSTAPSYPPETPSQMRLESVLPLSAKTPTLSSLSQFTYKSDQRRSMDSLSHRSQSSERALTICASTQTDQIGMFESPGSHLNLELKHLASIIRELREEQQQMRQVIETFLLHQTTQQAPAAATVKVFCSEKATQCEIQNSGNGAPVITHNVCQENLPPLNIETETLHRGLPNVKMYSPTLKDAARPAAPPVAQSTTYRPNTPNNLRSNGPHNHNQYVQNMTTLPSPSTERSMVMNELALKYLPSEKLTELMQDAQITTVPQRAVPPLRESDNFNKAPTDISNASYKYLRKYRLLPDQNQNGNSPTQNGAQSSSAFQERLQDSPLACSNGSAAAETDSPHLDLEHIRRQPKFL